MGNIASAIFWGAARFTATSTYFEPPLPSRGSLLHHTGGGKSCTLASGRRSRRLSAVGPSCCRLRISSCLMCFSRGLCGSVDSIRVFNPGDGTGGALSAFLPPFVAQDKRRCPRGMSAISFGQFRTSGIAGAARFTTTSTYFEPPGLYFSFGQFRRSGIAGAARFTTTSTYFEPPLPSRGGLRPPEVSKSLPLGGRDAANSVLGGTAQP